MDLRVVRTDSGGVLRRVLTGNVHGRAKDQNLPKDEKKCLYAAEGIDGVTAKIEHFEMCIRDSSSCQ